MTTKWNADDYHRLSEPQVAWGRRVLAGIALEGHERVLDAGCGTGRLTALLLDRLPEGSVVGLDRSLDMLRAAARRLRPRFGLRVTFVHADLTAVPLRRCAEMVFSTATFHWVLDHRRLFTELHHVLQPGGRLVAQCGGAGNLDRIHARAMRMLQAPEYENAFREWPAPWEFADPVTTSNRLRDAGFTEIRTSLEEAPTVLADRKHYRDFLATVILRVHLSRLGDGGLRDRFLDAMADAAAGDDPPFSLDYWRLNIDARVPGR